MQTTIKTTLLATLLAISVPALAQEEGGGAFTLEGNLTATSDYVFRGVSQSSENPALQPSLTLSHESGLYANVWASNVDFDTPGDGISVEVDYTLGWSTDVAEGVNLDLSAVRYTYPGSNRGFGIDYNEFIGTVTLNDNWFAKIGYTSDYSNSGENAVYYQVGGGWDIGETGVNFHFSGGYYDLDNYANDSYYDFQVGFAKDFGPFNIDLSYFDTSSFGVDLGDQDLADSRIVVTVSYDFSIF